MWALSERDVLSGVLTRDVELVGGRTPVGLVAIRRCDPTDNLLAGRDRDSSYYMVTRPDPSHVLRRRLESEKFFDGVVQQVRLLQQQVPLLPLFEERMETERRLVHGRVHASQ